MFIDLIYATDLPRENDEDDPLCEPLLCFRDTSVPPAFTLILTAFALTTNGLLLFVEGFCGEGQSVWAVLWLGGWVGGGAGLPLLVGNF